MKYLITLLIFISFVTISCTNNSYNLRRTTIYPPISWEGKPVTSTNCECIKREKISLESADISTESADEKEIRLERFKITPGKNIHQCIWEQFNTDLKNLRKNP